MVQIFDNCLFETSHNHLTSTQTKVCGGDRPHKGVGLVLAHDDRCHMTRWLIKSYS